MNAPPPALPAYLPPPSSLYGFLLPDGRRAGISSSERPFCPRTSPDERPHQLKLKEPIVTDGLGRCRSCGIRVYARKFPDGLMLVVEVTDAYVRRMAGAPMTPLETLTLLRCVAPGVADDLERRGTEDPLDTPVGAEED